MKYLDLEIYKDFNCIGSECPFSCCGGGWRIIIDDTTDKFYQAVDGEMGKKLKNCISRVDGVSTFILTAEGDCPFLNENHLCDIYCNLGKEHLCYTCTTYPRYSYLSGDIVLSGVSISCPEVARFFLAHNEPLQIDFAEDEARLQEESKMDWYAFNQSVRAFTTSIAIVQNRNYTIRERVTILTLFQFQFQTYVDEKRDSSGVINLFGNASYYNEILSQALVYHKDLKAKVDFCSELMSFFRRIQGFDKILPELSKLVKYYENEENTIAEDKLSEAFEYFDNEEEKIWQEQLLTYSLYRYFMQGNGEGDFYNKYMIGFLLVYRFYIAVLALYYQCSSKMPDYNEQVIMIAHISRVVEHENAFRDAAIAHFCENGMTDPAFIFRLIS